MNNVKIENKELLESLGKIDDEDEVKEIIFKAIKKGAKKLRDTTRSLYKSYMPTANNKMVQGVKFKNDKAYTESTVHIMGDYRNKWFEKGTQVRRRKSNEIDHYWGKHAVYKKNGGSTGRIEGKHFFKDAQRMSDADIQDIMNKTINDELKKIQ